MSWKQLSQEQLAEKLRSRMRLTDGERQQVLHQLDQHRVLPSPVRVPPEGPEIIGNLQVDEDVMRPDIMTSRWVAEYLSEHPDLYKDKTVLDMGCGTGILGLVTALHGAKTVYFSDVMPQATANVAANVSRLQTTLEGLDPKPECKVLPPGDLFAPLEGHASRVDLIVFNHPFFCDAPLNDVPVSRAMLDPGDCLRSFLEQAQRFCMGPILIPFYTHAGRGNDPYLVGPGYGYRVLELKSWNVDDGAQQGHIVLYELKAEAGRARELGAIDQSRRPEFEQVDWARTLRPASNGLQAADSARWQNLRSKVFAPILEEVYELVPKPDRKNLGLLLVYYEEKYGRKTRVESEPMFDDQCAAAAHFRDLYREQRELLQDFDPTREILRDAVSAHAAPFYLTFDETGASPSIDYGPPCSGDASREDRPPFALGRYSERVLVRYQRGAAGVIPPVVAIPQEDVEQNRWSRFLSLPGRCDAFQRYLGRVMSKYFDKNAALGERAVPDLCITLLPLWTGTLVHPVSIGAALVFTSGQPSGGLLRGVVFTAEKYLVPVRVLQWADEVARKTYRNAFSAVRHSLVNRAASVNHSSSVNELVASIQLEALCAEGAARFSAGVASGLDGSRPVWGDVGWGDSFDVLLKAALGSPSKPIAIDSHVGPGQEMDFRFFPLAVELVRNACKSTVAGNAVHVTVSESGGTIDLIIRNTSPSDWVRRIAERIQTLGTGGSIRGLLLAFLFAESLRDHQDGILEWQVGSECGANVIASHGGWCRVLGPADLSQLPAEVEVVTRAKGLRALVGATSDGI